MKPQDSEPKQTPIGTAFGYCGWCKGHASDVRLVAASDEGSGGRNHGTFACPHHREIHGLIPLADQP